jgi:hypothetical protein
MRWPFKNGEKYMKLRNAILALIVLSWIALGAIAVDTYNTSPITDEVSEAFQNEGLFNISPITGMSPNATADLVKIPGVVVVGSPAFVAGYWSFDLRPASSTMRLNLSQNQDAIFGAGDLIVAGSAVPVTAGGTIQGNRLDLYVVPVGSSSLYRMTLTLAPSSMNGNYVLTAGVTQPGIVFGSLIAPQQTGAPIVYSTVGQPHIMPVGPKGIA